MKQVQGFVTKAQHINNQAGQVAEFFELSPIGLTYSRNRGEYQNANYPNFTLHTFIGLDTTTKANLTSAVYTAQSAVNIARTVAAK